MQLTSHFKISNKSGKLCQKGQGVAKSASKLGAEVIEMAGMEWGTPGCLECSSSARMNGEPQEPPEGTEQHAL